MPLTTHETPLAGVREHPNGRSWQVRITPFPPRAGFETVADANEYARELRRRKQAGILFPPEQIRPTYRLLSEAAAEYLESLRTIGGRNGRPYSDEALATARKAMRVWLGEPIIPRKRNGRLMVPPPAVDASGRAFCEMPLAALSIRALEDYLARRYAETPRAAVGEQQALISILRRERRRGEQFDLTLLELVPLRRRPIERAGLSWAELGYLASFAQESQRRIFTLGGSLGGRIMELLHAEDCWFELDGDEGQVTLPAWIVKERRNRALDLLPEEVKLVREQRLVRSPNTRPGRLGTLLLFPRAEGGPWNRHGSFYNRVVSPARHKAARAWRLEHGLAEGSPTPFEWVKRDEHGRVLLDAEGSPIVAGFAPHDLRRGAADLLLELGIDPELAAVRLGHKDAGVLLLKKYAKRDKTARLRRELDSIAADGGIEARLAMRAAR